MTYLAGGMDIGFDLGEEEKAVWGLSGGEFVGAQ